MTTRWRNAQGGRAVAARTAVLPRLPAALAKPRFAADLPIAARMPEIVSLLRRERVVVVAGETGSGKTTQLPKACFAAGLGRRGVIAHTQPRRLAARAVSARIAAELGVALGAEVGYAVRFDERGGPATRLAVMTDGLLLAEMRTDPRLRRYECVIVDEAHERSLNVDFLLGGLQRLLGKRRDLKVVITSATIDVDAFAELFGGAPVVAVEGRGFPVEVVYRPIETGSRHTATQSDAERALVDCLAHIAKAAPVGRRDILVFQSGEREIFDNAKLLKRHFGERFDILPLYARLPAAQQARVFAPGHRQRVVLATNVAETSLTVPNIGYVVDPGFARLNRYSYRAKLQRLLVEPVSQASATQRAGRCGRIAPGVCYRLYSEDDHGARPRYTDPEVKRVNLAGVVLTLRAFHPDYRRGDIGTFPFIDPPARHAITDATRLLHELQALDDGELTDIGRAMARLPVDPRLARMLVEAPRRGALREVLVVVSALAAQDPRLRPLDRAAAADQAHAEFAKADAERRPSDFEVFLHIWRWLEEARSKLSARAFGRALEARFLSPARVREWRAQHRQLTLACRALGFRVNQQSADHSTLHRSLLAGSLGIVGLKRPSEAGVRRGAVEYDGPRGTRFRLFPGSVLRRSPPAWVMAAEHSDTGQVFARCVAAIEPEWLEEAAAHIAKHRYSSARWDAARGEAIVLETVTVYGLTVASERPRRAAEVDLEAARELFALEGLVRVDQRVRGGFLARNALLVRRVQERQGKLRRMDLLASEQARAAFYLARLPADVCSVATWERYATRATAAELAKFEMREADVLPAQAAAPRDEDFPPVLRLGPHRLAAQSSGGADDGAGAAAKLAYKFAPGAPDDGITVRVDLAGFAGVDADALEWLVPGFLEEKCLALVKALPKRLRRQLVPAADRVATLVPRLLAPNVYRQGRLATALSVAALECLGVRVPAGEWRMDAVPAHLRMNVAVSGRRGRGVLAEGRDLAALRKRLLATVERAVAPSRTQLEQRSITAFPARGVPDSIVVGDRGARARVYPVLVDRGDSVDLLVRAKPQGRTALQRRALARLALLAQHDRVRRLRRDLERDDELARGFRALGGIVALADAVLLAAAWRAYFAEGEMPTTREAFQDAVAAVPLGPVVADTIALTREILAKRLAVADALDAMRSPTLEPSGKDMRTQLDLLAGPRFLVATPAERLADLPRYLDALAYRIDRLRVGGRVGRDQAGIASVAAWEARLVALQAADVPLEVEAELRFLVQEFRVATFSQAVGTRGKVSAPRLEARFRAAEAAAGLD